MKSANRSGETESPKRSGKLRLKIFPLDNKAVERADQGRRRFSSAATADRGRRRRFSSASAATDQGGGGGGGGDDIDAFKARYVLALKGKRIKQVAVYTHF